MGGVEQGGRRQDGRSALHCAASGGHGDVVSALLTAKADLGAKDGVRERSACDRLSPYSTGREGGEEERGAERDAGAWVRSKRREPMERR